MNKWEKEVQKSLLESEKETLEALEKHYRKALQDIDEKVKILLSDELTQSRVYRLNYQTALHNQVAGILEKLHSDEYTTISQFLKDSYNNGFVGTMYDLHGQGVPMLFAVDPQSAVKAVLTDSKLSAPLYKSLGIDINSMKKRVSAEITRGIAAGMSNYEIARNLHNASKAPLSRARTIARTESHRIQEAASFDAGKLAKSKGADIVKQWDASLDGDTRETHRALDGKIVELEEPFVSGNNKAMYPGDFGDPAEDCNCRCSVLKRARSALDEEELKILQERAAFFGLDKTEDFEDFKKKYLYANKVLQTPGNAGEKAVPYSKRGIDIEARVKNYAAKLTKGGDYISDVAGTFKNEDLAILTTETGVEYTSLTIGEKSYLIRGFERGTTISKELIDELLREKGTLDCHSHPFIGDLVPSEADKDFLRLLTWQKESVIIEPTQNAVKFTAEGLVETFNGGGNRDDYYYNTLFDEGDD